MPIPPLPPGVLQIQSGPWTCWVIEFGARMVQLWYRQTPLLLGFADPADYRQDPASIGAICGRYGNRIENAILSYQGKQWALDANEGQQCLHGGRAGLGRQSWQVLQQAGEYVTLGIDSPDLDQGWPGRLQARVTYRVTPSEVTCHISGTVDQPCPLNLIQHNYWNLGCDAAHHQLTIPSQATWDNDSRNLPVELRATQPADDFQTPRLIGSAPFDRTYQVEGAGMRHVAGLRGPYGALSVFSDQPYLQLYTADYLAPTGKPLGAAHTPGNAVCLETQQLPNGPALNQPVWIHPNQRYAHQMRWEFTPA